jgi:DNA primase
VSLRYEGDSAAEHRASERRKALYRANEQAAALFTTMLASGKEATDARAYVTERGITPEAIEMFQVGYAPGYADFLLRRLGGARDLSSDILLEAGLASRGDDGTVRDRFRGRITFPIQDLQGRYIGFGARVLPSDARAGEQAKYLNTAETPIYRKHEVLYNMHRARQAVAKTGDVFVVEGYTDVIGLAQAGIANVVATCGTALGERHFEQLSRFATRAILAFDSDEAGARAAERAFGFQETYPITAVVLIMPEGLDPADFVAKHGADAVQIAAASARPLVEYMVRRTVERQDLSTIEGRSAAVATALPVLERLTDPIRRSEYAGLLADLAGVSHASVAQSLHRHLGGKPAEVASTMKRGTARERVEREVLRLIARGDLSPELAARIDDADLATPKDRRLFVALRDAGWDGGALVGGADTDLAAQIAALTVEPLEGDPTPAYADAVLDRLRTFALKGRSDEMRGRLQRLNPTTDAGYDDLFRQLVEIDGELRRLKERSP